MAKTTPVRWWRDDDTRYLPRNMGALAPEHDGLFASSRPPPISDEWVALLEAAYERRRAQWMAPDNLSPIHDVRTAIEPLRSLGIFDDLAVVAVRYGAPKIVHDANLFWADVGADASVETEIKTDEHGTIATHPLARRYRDGL